MYYRKEDGMYEVEFYRDHRGRCQVIDFLGRLQIRERAKVTKWIEMLERQGPDLPRPYADIVQGKIRELRIGFGTNEYRFLYFFYGKKILITHGFIKKTDKVPVEDIEMADRIMEDFTRRA
jgi:phage-related protein